MRILLFMQAICISLMLTACCSSSQQWGQTEGYQDITFVNNGQPLSLSSKAPRDDTYGLWQLSDKRRVGNCVYRDGSDSLILTVSLHKGEALGFRKSKDGMEAYAGNLCVPLSHTDYSWRLEITDEDRKQIAQEEFRYGVTDVGCGILEAFAYCLYCFASLFAGLGTL
jgi:hypothetical protein